MKCKSNRIAKLPQEVINIIAAGEVVQRPANVVKELVENSIDAHATEITVQIEKGGLNLIKIIDNGDGIHSDDLELLCTRHATSKLSSAKDLSAIATFGFRGEALAAVSCVAKVKVISRLRGCPFANMQQYNNCEPIGEPKPCASNQGTTLIVEDLFNNLVTRRSALQTNIRSSSDYITWILNCYALQCIKIAIHLSSDGTAIFNTSSEHSFETTFERLFSINFNESMLSIPISNEQQQQCQFKLNRLVLQKPSYTKSITSRVHCTTVFINNRLVNWPEFSASIELTHREALNVSFLQMKRAPFVFLSIDIEPHRIDVNVHPCKEVVVIINSSEILQTISKAIVEMLRASNASVTMTSMKGSLNPPNQIKNTSLNSFGFIQKTEPNTEQSSIQRIYPHQQVRTDNKQLTLHQSINASQLSQKLVTDVINEQCTAESIHLHHNNSQDQIIKNYFYSSICQFLIQARDEELDEIFQNCTYIGVGECSMMLLQVENNLITVNIQPLIRALIISIIAFKAGDVASIKFTDVPILQYICDASLFVKYQKYLLLCGIEITKVSITVPMPIDIEPNERDIVSFLRDLNDRLADFAEKNDKNEKTAKRLIFESVKCIGELYARRYNYTDVQDNDFIDDEIKNNIFPLLKINLIYPKNWRNEIVITKLASTHDFYKVFERC